MSEDEWLGDERGLDEPIAAFAALGGRALTGDEFMRLLGCGAYHGTLVRLAALLLGGDAVAAEAVAGDSLAALQAWSRLSDPEKARVYLYQLVVNRARSVRQHRAVGDRDTPQAAPDAPGGGRAATGDLGRELWVVALRGLPVRQREAVVLHTYLGLSVKQAAEVMCISAGAARVHLARGMSSLARLPRPEWPEQIRESP